MEKIISQLDVDGYCVGPIAADESPLDPGVFLIPGGAIDRAPPERMQPGIAYRPADAGDGWIEEEDHRHERLYHTSDGAMYPLGAQRGDETYNGIGPIPAWLRDEAAWTARRRPWSAHGAARSWIPPTP